MKRKYLEKTGRGKIAREKTTIIRKILTRLDHIVK